MVVKLASHWMIGKVKVKVKGLMFNVPCSKFKQLKTNNRKTRNSKFKIRKGFYRISIFVLRAFFVLRISLFEP